MVKSILIKTFVIGCAFASLGLGAKPAAALDDGKGNSLLDVLDFVGLGEKKDQEVIFYRERPPLVLPPKMELRQPVPPVAQRAADWPKDQEAVRAAKKAAENRTRVQDSAVNDPHYAGKLTREGRINAADVRDRAGPNQECSMVPDSPNRCDPSTYWKNLAVKSDTPAQKNVLEAGVEPDRQYLTSPPKGYMAPTKTVKATAEAPKPESDSIFEYFRNGGGK